MTAEARREIPVTPDFSKIGKVHVIGICGTAMGSLAAMLKERGFEVTGSDRAAYPPMSTWLEARGLTIRDGFDAANVDGDVDLVVVGNVARSDNPEANEAERRGLPSLSLPEVLRTMFFPEKDVLCVTGTHGKTTTSSMLAWILHETRHDPSFFIGGVTRNFDSNYRLGDGRSFVIEGDEYDTAYFDKVPKFWHYPARAATINNVEFDHVDIYPDINAILHVFRRFAAQVPDDGELWVNGDDKNALLCSTSASARIRTFGLGASNELRATNIDIGLSATAFHVEVDGETVAACSLPLAGEYNVRNFLGAAALAQFVGVSWAESAAAIASFEGVKKRQELVGECADILVIDDFAHHPTAVANAIEAVRARYPNRTLWALFEAKSNTSRRSTFQDDYPVALRRADHVVLSPPWKEDNLPTDQRISIDQLVRDIEGDVVSVHSLPDVEEIAAYVADNAARGDVILGLSGSAFGGVHQKILDRLEARFS